MTDPDRDPALQPLTKPAYSHKARRQRFSLCFVYNLDDLQEVMEVELIQKERENRRVRRMHYEQL